MPSWWGANYRMPWTQTNLDLGNGDVLTLVNFPGSTLHREDFWFW